MLLSSNVPSEHISCRYKYISETDATLVELSTDNIIVYNTNVRHSMFYVPILHELLSVLAAISHVREKLMNQKHFSQK